MIRYIAAWEGMTWTVLILLLAECLQKKRKTLSLDARCCRYDRPLLGLADGDRDENERYGGKVLVLKEPGSYEHSSSMCKP